MIRTERNKMAYLMAGMISIPTLIMWGILILLITPGIIAAAVYWFSKKDHFEYGGAHPIINPAVDSTSGAGGLLFYENATIIESHEKASHNR
jgi:hypothetical protein